MSLDVYLESDSTHIEPERWAIFVREGGRNKEISREEWDRRYPGREPVMAKVGGETRTLFHGNITHNLNEMAHEAELYKPLWRPETVGIKRAQQLIEPLAAGLRRLQTDPARFQRYDSPNGWGTYEDLVEFVEEYLAACRAHPDATVRVSR